MKRLFWIILVILLMGIAMPTAIFADEGHGSNDAHVEDDGHDASDGHHNDNIGRNALIAGGIAAAIGAAVALGVGGVFGRPLGIVLALLTAATGGIHLIYGLNGSTLLLLNSLGYFALLALLLLPFAKSLRTWIGIALIIYAGITIGGYMLDHNIFQDTVGLITKLIEVALIITAAMFIGQTRNDAQTGNIVA